ncbi:MAG: amidohydrolase [Bacteroidia bacterium]|nr:amidohydrolase [Bacteroidia bacterium]
MEALLQKAKSLLPELKRWRRHLHEYPELSFQEYETQRFLLHELEKISGIRVKKAGNTGIVADLITAEQGPWIALRADMDALPIQEIERPHCSKRAGIMHACGHDAHTAMLLGAAHLLWGERRSWQGGIRLIFQPGEEKAPGGASLLLQEGILDEVPIQAIWAQHVTPQLPVGKIGLRSGPFMAASDEFHLTLKGPGGHAAYPHLTPDPIAVGSQLITHLQQVVSRAADPRSPTVLTFGKFQAGSAPNIIPTEAALAGTLRTFDEGWRRKARELITHLVHSTAEAWGLHAHLTFYPGYPVLQNDPLPHHPHTRLVQGALGTRCRRRSPFMA